MKLRVLGVPVCLALIAAVTPLRESVAGSSKVDLEAYLGGVPMQDDTKTFLTEGDEITNTIIGVNPGPKRSAVVSEQTHGETTSRALEVVVHGKNLLQGTVVQHNGTDEIAFVTPKPKKAVAFHLKQGKAYKFKIPSTVFFNGMKVAKAVEFGTVTFLGFEDVVTPLGTFEGAAHLMRINTIRLKSGKDRFEVRSQTESWVDADLGNLRFIRSEKDFDNGMLTDSIPATEWLFDHGVILGVPIGPPMPAGGASASSGAMASAEASASAVGSIWYYDPPTSSAGIDVWNADASLITVVPSGASALVGAETPSGLASNRPVSDANAP